VLSRRGLSVHGSKVWVYGGCAALVGLSALSLPWLQKGNLLLGVLLLIAFGSLGLFPCYYSFSQELSVRHQGRFPAHWRLRMVDILAMPTNSSAGTSIRARTTE